jgi:hypothetical protein
VNLKSRAERQDSNSTTIDTNSDVLSPTDQYLASDANALFGSLSGDIGLEIGNEFDLDTADWMFWDQLIQDHQVQG